MKEFTNKDYFDQKFNAYCIKQLRFALIETIKHTFSTSVSNLNIQNFSDFVIQLVEHKFLSKLDLFQVFEDLFECVPERELETLFGLMEEQILQRNILSNDSEENKAILPHCAKICKMIMKRLSVTKDTRFRGRIQALIAAAFPLTHPAGIYLQNCLKFKLGLNRSGQFNTKNTTEFQSLEEIRQELSKTKGQVNAPISDYKMYKNFWNLQKYITNPFQIFSSEKLGFEENWENQMDQDMLIDPETLKTQDINNHEKEMSVNEEEEGQAEPEHSGTIEAAEIMSAVAKKEEESNLDQVLSTINDFLNKFLSQPIQVDKENAKILDKYPKYLSKYSLLNLQFSDYLFRETFLTQVLIFFNCLKNPITLFSQQKKAFVLQEEEKKQMSLIEQKVYQLLQDSSIDQSKETQRQTLKRKSMQESTESILERESQWCKWKENKCYNYEKKPNLSIDWRIQAFTQMPRKREQKMISKAIEVKGQGFNTLNKAQSMFHLLKMPKESITEPNKTVKQGELPTLSEYLYPLCADMDPDQGIEDQYKKKYNQVFCWRFLRSVAFIDSSNFQKDLTKFTKFEGDVEEVATILQKKAPKRDIVLQKPEEPERMEIDHQTNGNVKQEEETPAKTE